MMKTAILFGLVALLVTVPGASASAINTIVVPGGGGSCSPAVACVLEIAIDACNGVVYFLVGGHCYP